VTDKNSNCIHSLLALALSKLVQISFVTINCRFSVTSEMALILIMYLCKGTIEKFKYVHMLFSNQDTKNLIRNSSHVSDYI
jgi:hypothetical protein